LPNNPKPYKKSSITKTKKYIKYEYTLAGYSPWKFPPETTSPVSIKTSGLSVALFISVVMTFCVNLIVSHEIP